MKEKPISLTGFGNPVIDIIVNENTSSLIDKYNLKPDTQNDLPLKTYDHLRRNIQSDAYKKTYIPGGCVQNTVRIFQWLENERFKTIMYGSIGSDEHGKYLTEQLRKEGVITRFDTVTGTGSRTEDAVLLTQNQYRTIVYSTESQAACYKFSEASEYYLKSTLTSIADTKMLLFDGYFTLHCVPFSYRILEECEKHDVLVAFSAGGESIIKAEKMHQTYLPFVQRSHLLSLNMREFKAICERIEIHTEENMESALELFFQSVLSKNTAKKTSCKYGRIITVTDGENPVHCYTEEKGYFIFPIEELAVNQIKDTTGAGDAFMAGLLYGIS